MRVLHSDTHKPIAGVKVEADTSTTERASPLSIGWPSYSKKSLGIRITDVSGECYFPLPKGGFSVVSGIWPHPFGDYDYSGGPDDYVDQEKRLHVLYVRPKKVAEQVAASDR